MSPHLNEVLLRLAAAIPNPLNGIVPNFTIFGAQFNSIWKKTAAGLWALGIMVAIFYLGRGVLAYAQSEGIHPTQMRDAKKEAVRGAIALGGLVALPVLVGMVITLFSV